jgi:hypothetical protein
MHRWTRGAAGVGYQTDMPSCAALHPTAALRVPGAARSVGLLVALPPAADVVVTVALANTLFFSLPLNGARHEIGLYLALVLSPVAVLTPLVSALLERTMTHGGRVLVATLAMRCAIAVLLMGTSGPIWYPLALALLLSSRAHGIARTAVAADFASGARDLLRLNTWISALASVGAAGGGALAVGVIAVAGAPAALLAAAGLYALAAQASLRVRFTASGMSNRTPVDSPRNTIRKPTGPVAPLTAAAVLRAVTGFLTVVLAVRLKQHPAALTAVTAVGVVGAAGGTFGATLLRRRVAQQAVPSVMAATVGAVLVATSAHPDLPLYAIAAGAVGFGWATAKIALDGQLQQCGDYRTRRGAVSACAGLLQLCWVVGASAGLLPVDSSVSPGCAGATLLVVSGLLHLCRAGPVGEVVTRSAPGTAVLEQARTLT